MEHTTERNSTGQDARTGKDRTGDGHFALDMWMLQWQAHMHNAQRHGGVGGGCQSLVSPLITPMPPLRDLTVTRGR